MKKSDSDEKSRRKIKKTKENIKNSKGTSIVSSPYIKPKSRSLSNSKSILNLKSPTQTIFSNTKKLFQDSTPLSAKQKQFFKQTHPEIKLEINADEDIEKRLMQDIKNAKNTEHEFEIYQKYFGELIKLDKKYDRVLLMIKAGYDSRVANAESSLASRLKIEIKELQNIIQKENKEKKLFLRKLEKLSKENVELSRGLDDTESKYNDLIARLNEISKFDLSALPKEEITWKSLVLENQGLSRLNKEMQADIKTISSKEKKLVSLLVALKSQGYPVEEIYEKQLAKSMRSITPQGYSEDTDTEALISGRAKIVKKPAIIPKLNLDDVQNDAFSNDSFFSQEG